MRHFGTLPTDGRWVGWGVLSPPATCQTAGQILDPNTAFDSPGLELPEYAAKFYLYITDDLTSWVKGEVFYIVSSLASPGKADVSD